MFLRGLWDVCLNGDLIEISPRHLMPAGKSSAWNCISINNAIFASNNHGVFCNKTSNDFLYTAKSDLIFILFAKYSNFTKVYSSFYWESISLLRIHWRISTILETNNKSVWNNVSWYVKVCIFWNCIQYTIH